MKRSCEISIWMAYNFCCYCCLPLCTDDCSQCSTHIAAKVGPMDHSGFHVWRMLCSFQSENPSWHVWISKKRRHITPARKCHFFRLYPTSHTFPFRKKKLCHSCPILPSIHNNFYVFWTCSGSIQYIFFSCGNLNFHQ